MKTDPPIFRCPFTVDWVRNSTDVEIQQLVLLEVPRLEPMTVVFDIGSDRVAFQAVLPDMPVSR